MIDRLPMTFTYSQALDAGLTRAALYRLRDDRLVQPLARGLYRRADAMPVDLTLAAVVARAPRATMCLVTALARHDLTDEIPGAHDLALPRGTRRPAITGPVRWHSFDRDTFDIERDLVTVDGGLVIGLYSAERSIIDAFRLRGTEGADLAYEALRRWLRRRGSQPADLLAVASHWPRAVSPVRSALELLQ
ncbi:MAG: type IV toxin-antitoxin system AbiEi family antitoxin domain-containing protein [Kineosporiaceae bacterium]